MRQLNVGLGGVLWPTVLAFCVSRPLKAADCNHNGLDDAKDIAAGRTSTPSLDDYAVGSEPYTVIAADLNGDERLRPGNPGQYLALHFHPLPAP